VAAFAAAGLRWERAGPQPEQPQMQQVPPHARSPGVASVAVGELRQRQGQEGGAVPGHGQASPAGLGGRGLGGCEDQEPLPAPASPGPRQAAPAPAWSPPPWAASAAAPGGTPAASQAAATPAASHPPGAGHPGPAATPAKERAAGDAVGSVPPAPHPRHHGDSERAEQPQEGGRPPTLLLPPAGPPRLQLPPRLPPPVCSPWEAPRPPPRLHLPPRLRAHLARLCKVADGLAAGTRGAAVEGGAEGRVESCSQGSVSEQGMRAALAAGLRRVDPCAGEGDCLLLAGEVPAARAGLLHAALGRAVQLERQAAEQQAAAAGGEGQPGQQEQLRARALRLRVQVADVVCGGELAAADRG
jgi:hypothetical protein